MQYVKRIDHEVTAKVFSEDKLNNISTVYINYVSVLYEATSVHRLTFVYLCVHIKIKKKMHFLCLRFICCLYIVKLKKEKNGKTSEVKKIFKSNKHYSGGVIEM